MLVDHHAHWLPEPVLAALARRTAPPRAWHDGRCWVFQAAARPRELDRSAHDLAHRAQRLAALAIGQQVLSWSPLWNLEALDPDEAVSMARQFNDETAAQLGSSRYRGLAVIPLSPPSMAIEELRRAAGMGMEGFVLPAWTLRDARTAEDVVPLFEAAAALALRIFVHPGTPPRGADAACGPSRRQWHRHLGLAPQHEVGLAMLTLCQEGWLAAFPTVSVQFANGGGGFVAALERMQRMSEDDVHSAAMRDSLLARVMVDSASLGPVGIAAARSLLGADAVLFGTDMPIFDVERAVDDWWLSRHACARSTLAMPAPGLETLA